MKSPSQYTLLVFLLLTTPSPSFSQPKPLEGLKLRCCTLEQTPISFRNPSKPSGFDGLAISYLHTLESRLGFSCHSLENPTDSSMSGIGFSTFINNLEACTTPSGTARVSPDCKCDLGVNGFIHNADRLSRVDYVHPFVIDSFAVLVRKSDTFASGGALFFFTAFDQWVWLTIAALGLLFVLLKVLDSGFVQDPVEFQPLPPSEPTVRRIRHYLLKSNMLYRLRRAMQSTFNNWIRMSEEHEDGYPPMRQWILNSVIVLCGLFLVLAYESAMVASLVQEKNSSDYRSIDSFNSCFIPASSVCVPNGGAVRAYWDQNIAKRSCYDPNNGPRTYDRYDEGVELLLSGECNFLFALGSKLEFEASRKHCGKIVTTGIPAIEDGISFVLPKGSNLTNAMSKATLRGREDNEIPTLAEYIDNQKACNFAAQSTLTFRKLRIFFVIVFVICVFLFLEILLNSEKERDSQRGDENELDPCQNSESGVVKGIGDIDSSPCTSRDEETL